MKTQIYIIYSYDENSRKWEWVMIKWMDRKIKRIRIYIYFI